MLLTIDESAQSVYSSGITPMQGEPEKMLVPKALGTGSQLAIEIDGEVSMFEYNMSMAFDPRVTPGMWVHSVGANGKSGAAARSLGAGSLFFTKSVQHIIGGDEWVTQINGPILDSDLISVRRKVA